MKRRRIELPIPKETETQKREKRNPNRRKTKKILNLIQKRHTEITAQQTPEEKQHQQTKRNLEQLNRWDNLPTETMYSKKSD